MKKVIGCMLPNAAEIRDIIERLKPHHMEVIYIPNGGEERQVMVAPSVKTVEGQK